MKIAIIGWGSLIWNPQNLAYNIDLNWMPDGPLLPIEYSRISADGRLTLVIADNVKHVKTYYAYSTIKSLDLAILNLAVREGSNISTIGYYIKNENHISPNNFTYQKEIKNWIELNNNIDAVIWTNLTENWKTKTQYKSRIDYLVNLPKEVSKVAEEYIRKTPLQINTLLRKEIEEKLNWEFIEKFKY